MNKFKVGDKVTVKENFWEIKGDGGFVDKMKELVGRTLELDSVSSNGSVHTKQDDSYNDTVWAWHKDWLEPYNPTITWETLKWKDVVVEEDGKERLVLDVRNDLVDLSYIDDFNRYFTTYHKQQLQDRGFTIKQPTPTIVEKLELTLEQMVDNFVVDVTNIKIKK